MTRALRPLNLYAAYQAIVDLDDRRVVAYEGQTLFINAEPATFGTDISEDPAVGVGGANLSRDDALAGEWTVVVVGSHYAGALIAKDCGDDGPEIDRRFEFVVSHDRALVLDAARSLLSRLIPLG